MQRIRKGIVLKDAVNCSVTKEYTQIPNELICNPNISGKAKAILYLLLSNKDGWYSHVKTILLMMREKEESILTGLIELEHHGYLLRIRYRDVKSKSFKGILWAYTNVSNKFNMDTFKDLFKSLNYKITISKSQDVKTYVNPKDRVAYAKNIDLFINFSDHNICSYTRTRTRAINNIINNIININNIEKRNKENPKQKRKKTDVRIYLPIARKLSTIVRKIKNVKHTYSQLGRWSNHIQFLVEKNKVSVDRIYEALKWYSKHHADKYTPVIESGDSLRNKFIKLEDAIKRDSENNHLSKILSVAELHEQIKNRMNGVRKDTIQRMIVMFDNVCNLSPNMDKVTLINNLNNLYLNIIESRPNDAMKRSHHGEDIGTPIYLIEEYYQWLKDSTWINDINENTIMFKSKLFKKFLNHFGDEIGLDPLTGDYK